MTEPVNTRPPHAGAEVGRRAIFNAQAGPIPEAIVEQAIAWYVRLASGMETDQDFAAFSRWAQAHPDHARAWARLDSMRQRLHGARGSDPAVSMPITPTLRTFFDRRKTLKCLAWSGVIGGGLIVGEQVVPWRRQFAVMASDVHTPVGGSRNMTLPDGTRLKLNTDTALDLDFDGTARRIILRRGEILVDTHQDAAGTPMVVRTGDGDLAPVGTRFTVRRVADAAEPHFTRVLVIEGAVVVRSRHAQAAERQLVRAGQQTCVMRDRVEAPAPLDGALLAWIDGMFAAERMRLDQLLAELGRYRPGWLHCAPEVASLRITGVWPVGQADATDRILDSLARRLPVRIRRFTRYAVSVTAA